MSIGTLISKQNPDGGWPYVQGGSWTEPTIYAVMALLSTGETEAVNRGLRWIRSVRRSDGGWAPRTGIDQSTWVTGLVALLPPEVLGLKLHQNAVQWLLGTEGKETTRTYRLREWLLGIATPNEQEFPGWPWVPGTAAWVGPTAIAILALQKENRRRPSPRTKARIDEGQRFLLTRMCKGGGWNHGSSNALGYAANPYPETTGMALAALRGASGPKVLQGIGVAQQFLASCRSADALNWLRLGLRAHDQLPRDFCPPIDVIRRTVPESSLEFLVTEAVRQNRDNFFDLV